MIYIYVIKSIEKNFRYVGITSDLERRLREHHSGKNKSTAPFEPFDLKLKEEFKDYKEARIREKFLKSG